MASLQAGRGAGPASRSAGPARRGRQCCVPAQARIDSPADARLLSGLGAAASAKASVVIGGRRVEELAAHPANGRAFWRGCWREICAHLEVADRRQGRHQADTTSRGPDRAHGFLFVPGLHTGTSDEPRATRHAPGTDRGFSCSPAQKDTNHVEHDAQGTEDEAGPIDRSCAAARPRGGAEPGSGARSRRAAGKSPRCSSITSRSASTSRARSEPVVAIADVSLRLERGGTIGILGANGSGKSTLIRLVSGLLTLDEGRVEVFGHDIEREEMAVKRLINRVSVDAAFFKKLSPMENLLFAARLYGIDAKARPARDRPDHRAPRHRREAPRPAGGADEPGHAAEDRDRASPADEPGAAAPGRADDGPRPAVEARRPDVHRGDPGEPRRVDRADDARPRRGRAAVRRDRRSSTTAGSSPRARRKRSSDSSRSATARHRRCTPCS